MNSTNYELSEQMATRTPHIHAAMQHLVMAMADYQNRKGKKSFFGRDTGQKAYLKFEEKFSDLLRALVMDEYVNLSDDGARLQAAVLEVFDVWAEAFPNWPEAYFMAAELFIDNPNDGARLIEKHRP